MSYRKAFAVWILAGMFAVCGVDVAVTGRGASDSEAQLRRRVIQPTGPIIGAMYHTWYTPERWGGRGPYMPVLGEYDSADPAVIAQHISWAKQAGINTMVIDAWITDGDQGWMDRNTPNILDGFDRSGIKYFFIADGWFKFPGTDPGDLSAAAVASRVNAYLAKYFNRRGYLKVDSKPAVFFWASDGTPCEFWRRVRSGIEGTIGPIYMTGFTNSATDNKCFDRLMYYNPFYSADGSYQAQIANQDRMWNQVFKPMGIPWAPTATPGYNDVHLGRGNPPVPLDADYFRQSMQTALRAKSAERDRWIFVCSFNEWYEASVIEPNTSFPDSEVFVKVMRQELEAAGWISGSPSATDDAEIVGHTLPTTMVAGSTSHATITVRNTGAVWNASDYHLGAVGDADPFTATVRVAMPAGTTIENGQTYTFPVTLTAPAYATTQTTDWQMVHENVRWFGGIASSTVVVTAGPGGGGTGRLASGEALQANESVTSPDGRFTFIYQSDGNLVLYKNPSTPLWWSGTSGRSTGQAAMQGDGNLVVYDASNAPVWFSGTAGNPGAFLNIQTDGNAVIYTPGLSPVWETHTAGR